MYSTFFGECSSLKKRLYLRQWGFNNNNKNKIKIKLNQKIKRLKNKSKRTKNTVLVT